MPCKYRFRLPVDEFEVYEDGTEVPRRFSMIERQQTPNGRWVVVGFAEVQLVKVTRGEGDIEDLSVGFFGLVNPAAPEPPKPPTPPAPREVVVAPEVAA